MKEKEITTLSTITDNKNVIAVVCYQWGDTGKGKIIHLLSEDWAEIVIRGTGGANAGHTLINNGKEFIAHLLPSGILNPNISNILGRGVALDLIALKREMEMPACTGMSFDNLFISHEANLLMPYHILDDLSSAKSKLIGTTGCGIGPFYSDYYSRLSISINDLANEKIFIEKFHKFMDVRQGGFNQLDKAMVKEFMFGKKYGQKFLNGLFYDEKTIISRQAIIDYYFEKLAPMFLEQIIDLNSFNELALKRGQKILLEGAQGTLLSIDYGTTFYQTSSDSSIEGLAKGCCLKVSDIDKVLGIVKGPYMSRVGNGPFPSELGAEQSEIYCHDPKHNAESEKALNIDIKEAINYYDDELIQGLAVRMKGKEYGATTGRARRIGWLDLVALKHSININGPNIVLTKFDVMSGVKTIKLCTAYEYLGKPVFYAGRTIKTGERLTKFIRESEILSQCRPIYNEFPGWDKDISKIRRVSDLPDEIIDILLFIQIETGAKIVILSVGPSSEDTIYLNGDL